MDIKKLKAIGATYLRAGIAAAIALWLSGETWAEAWPPKP